MNIYEIEFRNPEFYVSDKTVGAWEKSVKRKGLYDRISLGKRGSNRLLTIKSNLTHKFLVQLSQSFIQKYDFLRITVVTKKKLKEDMKDIEKLVDQVVDGGEPSAVLEAQDKDEMLADIIELFNLKPVKKFPGHDNAKQDYGAKTSKGYVVIGDFGSFLSGNIYLGDMMTDSEKRRVTGTKGTIDIISSKGKWDISFFGPQSRTLVKNYITDFDGLKKLPNIIKSKGKAADGDFTKGSYTKKYKHS